VNEWKGLTPVARHITGHFRDGPPGNHLHWHGQQKLAAKTIKHKKKQNTMIY